MKLRDKETGEIGRLKESNCDEYEYLVVIDGNPQAYRYYHTIKEIADNYEDYEEPEKYWTVECGEAVEYTSGDERFDRPIEAVGLKFDTKEECDRAIEKLKAWKRLKDKGFRFSKDWVYRYDQPKVGNHTYFELVAICEDGVRFDDLDLLFGGEE